MVRLLVRQEMVDVLGKPKRYHVPPNGELRWILWSNSRGAQSPGVAGSTSWYFIVISRRFLQPARATISAKYVLIQMIWRGSFSVLTSSYPLLQPRFCVIRKHSDSCEISNAGNIHWVWKIIVTPFTISRLLQGYGINEILLKMFIRRSSGWTRTCPQ